MELTATASPLAVRMKSCGWFYVCTGTSLCTRDKAGVVKYHQFFPEVNLKCITLFIVVAAQAACVCESFKRLPAAAVQERLLSEGPTIRSAHAKSSTFKLHHENEMQNAPAWFFAWQALLIFAFF